MSHITRILSKTSPPVGPYSNAVRAHNTLYVSGCIGIDPSGAFTASDVVGQTTQAMLNMKSILEQAGASFDDVVKTTILLRDMADYPKVNDEYAKSFNKGAYPARATFAVAGLPKDALVEIEAIAVLAEDKK